MCSVKPGLWTLEFIKVRSELEPVGLHNFAKSSSSYLDSGSSLYASTWIISFCHHIFSLLLFLISRLGNQTQVPIRVRQGLYHLTHPPQLQSH